MLYDLALNSRQFVLLFFNFVLLPSFIEPIPEGRMEEHHGTIGPKTQNLSYSKCPNGYFTRKRLNPQAWSPDTSVALCQTEVNI